MHFSLTQISPADQKRVMRRYLDAIEEHLVRVLHEVAAAPDAVDTRDICDLVTLGVAEELQKPGQAHPETVNVREIVTQLFERDGEGNLVAFDVLRALRRKFQVDAPRHLGAPKVKDPGLNDLGFPTLLDGPIGSGKTETQRLSEGLNLASMVDAHLDVTLQESKPDLPAELIIERAVRSVSVTLEAEGAAPKHEELWDRVKSSLSRRRPAGGMSRP